MAFLDHLFEGRLGSGDEDEAGSFRRECLRDGASDAAGGAGHDDAHALKGLRMGRRYPSGRCCHT